MDPFLGARPSKIVHGFQFSTLQLHFSSGCVLEETHGTNNLEVEREMLKAEQKLLC